MHIIIDGYNFIFGIYSFKHEELQEVRTKFLLRLSKYVDRKNVTAEVVFDSGQEDLWPSTFFGKGVKVVFSENADDYIREKVEKSNNPASVMVVSSDREIVRDVRKQGAKIKSPQEFDMQLKLPGKKKKEDSEKPSPKSMSKGDVEGWLREFRKRKPKK